MIETADKVVELSQRSLLMHKFNIDYIKRDVLTAPPPLKTLDPDDPTTSKSITSMDIEIVGLRQGEKLTGKEVTNYMASFIDQMKDDVHAPPAEPQPQQSLEDDDDGQA